MLQKLPVSQSDFYFLRTANYLYVDKTSYVYQMLTSGGQYYFLARPRRFGKSLLVSTLYEALIGNKALFDGLALGNSDYDWQPHGVIKLDFSMLELQNAVNFNLEISETLTTIINKYKLEIIVDSSDSSIALQQVAQALHEKFGRVAILIDEYDSPILHSISHPQRAIKKSNILKSIFRTIKSLGTLINFVFITGIVSFHKKDLLSDLNDLQILTLDSQYDAICGYTDTEIDIYFSSYLNEWAQENNTESEIIRERLKFWYKGYNFSAANTMIYNPFALNNVIAENQLQNFWIQSGGPAFLIDKLKKQYQDLGYQLFDPEEFVLTKTKLLAFNIEDITLPTLMFQAGYLTITKYDTEHKVYHLGYPNHEIRKAMQSYLLIALTNANDITCTTAQLWTAWNNSDIDDAMMLLRILYSKVPYPLHVKLESFYHSLFQMICTTANIKSQSEYATSHGSIDMVMDLPKVLYIVEIKFNESAQIALKQIIDKRYYEPFVDQNKPIILLGLNFSKTAGDFALTHEYQ
ncbi:MAG TPA: AAA family ATPase, partial [Candidatus Babeliales bacterium]|nr:AAA family ATPase [Candidatus Babeliales bacterium]